MSAGLLARRARALGPAYRLFYRQPLHLVHGEDVWLYDHEGRRYLDAYNNVAAVGHGHPAVVEAIAAQAAKLNTNTRYLDETIVAYAETLLGALAPGLAHVMFCCSGSEANDLALRVARAASGGSGVIVTRNAYHGVTAATAALSPSLGPANQLGADVWTVPAPAMGGGEFTAGVAAALAEMASSQVRPAALFADTVFSSDGVFADPPGFLATAAARMRAAGGLFIADEVQAGFGRIGPAMWGFARHGLVPDLVTLGKPMGNGHPVAALAAAAEPVARFGRDVRYFSTFGGNPVSAAAAAAVLDIIVSDGLAERAAAVGGHLRARLEALKPRHGLIAEVRGAGLFVGVELGCGADAAAGIVEEMRDRGVLVSATGPAGNVVKIRPPLTFGNDHADMLADALDAALARAAG